MMKKENIKSLLGMLFSINGDINKVFLFIYNNKSCKEAFLALPKNEGLEIVSTGGNSFLDSSNEKKIFNYQSKNNWVDASDLDFSLKKINIKCKQLELAKASNNNILIIHNKIKDETLIFFIFFRLEGLYFQNQSMNEKIRENNQRLIYHHLNNAINFFLKMAEENQEKDKQCGKYLKASKMKNQKQAAQYEATIKFFSSNIENYVLSIIKKKYRNCHFTEDAINALTCIRISIKDVETIIDKAYKAVQLMNSELPPDGSFVIDEYDLDLIYYDSEKEKNKNNASNNQSNNGIVDKLNQISAVVENLYENGKRIRLQDIAESYDGKSGANLSMFFKNNKEEIQKLAEQSPHKENWEIMEKVKFRSYINVLRNSG